MFNRTRFAAAVAAVAFFVTGAGVANAAVNAQGSVEQVYATGLTPGAQMTLVDGKGKKVAAKKVDKLGGLLFRDVKPGSGYRVGRPAEASSRGR